MSELTRAFRALQGRTFPRIGDGGFYRQFGPVSAAHKGLVGVTTEVEVVDMTRSGITVAVRFIRSEMRTLFGVDSFRVLRRGEMFDGTGWYLPSGRVVPSGEVAFSPSGFVGPT